MGNSFVNKFYADNYINTYDEEKELIHDKVKLDSLMLEANMPLQEWVSNNVNFNCLYDLTVQEVQNVLGLDWEPNRDMLRIIPGEKLMNDANWQFTKRKILSLISSLFGLLGMLIPLSIKGKIFMQTLWKEKLGWDQVITSEDQLKVIREILHEFQRAGELCFSRRVMLNAIELRVFVDTSGKGYGAVAYSVETNFQSNNIVVSKARVAPCQENRLTIPKLELTAAVVGCRLLNHLKFIFSIAKFYLCSDSKAVLS